MIEVVKIEDFVIDHLFRPYMPSMKDLCKEYQSTYISEKKNQQIVERRLKRNPELIIIFLNENKGIKQRVFERLRLFGGIKWYRYLDMSNPVIQWVNENLEDYDE